MILTRMKNRDVEMLAPVCSLVRTVTYFSAELCRVVFTTTLDSCISG